MDNQSDEKNDEKNIMNYSFEDLDLNDELLRGIYSYGFEKPSKIQYKSIPLIKSGKDLIAQSQSGTGKTGAFSIGILNNIDTKLKKTQYIVLTPTHELAKQIYSVIENLGARMDITMCKVIGKTNISESIMELKRDPQIIVATPGRLVDMISKRHIFTDNIKTLVLDEADEMLSGGFMEILYEIIKCMPKKCQICLFSATMPKEILDLTENFMNNPERLLVNRDELTLEGIKQFYINLKQYNWKFDVLYDIYDTINITQSIIYVNSKNILNNLYDRLSRDEYPVSYIHGDMQTIEREKNLNDFKNGITRIMLSTDLLSRGIDIQQLSLVINFDLPRNKETYIHRIGRSGRYGRKGTAINFITDEDTAHMKEIEDFYNTKIEEMPQNLADYL
jgi:translation initiation factor 4A|tara:strand:- start:9510 stop:10682 length:1173 start_codon:yes stop_codon:yes gene_type:complete